MTAPSITSADTNEIIGTNFQGDISNTNLDLWYRFDTSSPLTDKSGNGRTIELNTSSIISGGVFQDGLDIDPNDFSLIPDFTFQGAFSISLLIKPLSFNVSGGTTYYLGKGTSSGDRSLLLDIATTGEIGIYLYSTTGELKRVVSTSPLTLSIWQRVTYTWSGVFSEAPKLYVQGVDVSSVGTNTTYTSDIRQNSTKFSLGRIYPSNDFYDTDAVFDDFRIYSRELSSSECLDLYSLTMFYKNNAYQETSLVTSTKAVLSVSPAIGTTIEVINIDGSDSAVTVSGSTTLTMTLEGSTSSIELPLALYGYKTIIAFNKQSVEKSNGTIGTFDTGLLYDRYICEFRLLLKESDADNLSNFYSSTDRAETLTLTPSGDFTPFSPLKGLGPFDVRILDFKEGGLKMDGAYKYFEYTIKMQNVGVFPAHSIPAQVNEGCLNIGSISDLRYPMNGITQKTKYKIGSISKYGKSVNLTDWTEEADSNQATYDLTLRRGNMGALLDEIVNTVRFGNLTIETSKPFGPINSDIVTAKLLNSKLEITHEGHERYTTSMDFIKV